jgi:hypothetical protein
MTDEQRPGMCAAYGCPLFGTVGSDGRWFCFCHVNKPNPINDSITRVLREEQMHIVEATLSIRRNFGSFHVDPDAYRALQRSLIEHRRAKAPSDHGADRTRDRPNARDRAFFGSSESPGGPAMTDNFDALWLALGIRRRDWTAPVQPQQPQG